MNDFHKLKIKTDDSFFGGEDVEFSIDDKSFFGLCVSSWQLKQAVIGEPPVLETEHMILGEEVETEVEWEPKFDLEHAPEKFKKYLYKRLDDELEVDASELETMWEGKYDEQ